MTCELLQAQRLKSRWKCVTCGPTIWNLVSGRRWSDGALQPGLSAQDAVVAQVSVGVFSVSGHCHPAKLGSGWGRRRCSPRWLTCRSPKVKVLGRASWNPSCIVGAIRGELLCVQCPRWEEETPSPWKGKWDKDGRHDVERIFKILVVFFLMSEIYIVYIYILWYLNSSLSSLMWYK